MRLFRKNKRMVEEKVISSEGKQIKRITFYPEKTQIIVKFGIDADTSKKLAGIPRPNNICGFVLVRPDDYKRIPKNIDYEKIIDEAIKRGEYLIEDDEAIDLLNWGKIGE